MTTISSVMTRDVEVIRPNESIQRAAQMMKEFDIGALPVCDGKRLLGMITDRDITLRSTADGKLPADVSVADVMSEQIIYCTEDETTEDVMDQMGECQVRRLPVINDQKELVGIVSLGDLATRQSSDTDKTLREISAP